MKRPYSKFHLSTLLLALTLTTFGAGKNGNDATPKIGKRPMDWNATKHFDPANTIIQHYGKDQVAIKPPQKDENGNFLTATQPTCGSYQLNHNGYRTCLAIEDSGGGLGGPKTDQIIFVSSKKYNGNFGGVNKADAECKTLAAKSNINTVKSKANWKAILSTTTVDAKTRIAMTGAIFNTKGEQVASFNGANTLFSGNLLHAVTYNENSNKMNGTQAGEASEGYESVWTGTDNDGNFRPAKDGNGACSDWTSSSDLIEATVGNHLADKNMGIKTAFSDGSSGNSGGADSSCEEFKYIYCISQPVGSAICGDPGNLVYNGCFENPVIDNSGKLYDFFVSSEAGWQVEWLNPNPCSEANPVAYLEFQKNGGAENITAIEGAQYAELDTGCKNFAGPQQGLKTSVRIKQTLATEAGSSYTLSFQAAKRENTNNGSMTQILTVKVDGAPIHSTAAPTGWAKYSYQFTANSSQTEISFEDSGDANTYGVLLDEVQVLKVQIVAAPACGGYQDFGACWYLSDRFESCRQACQSHGGLSGKYVGSKNECEKLFNVGTFRSQMQSNGSGAFGSVQSSNGGMNCSVNNAAGRSAFQWNGYFGSATDKPDYSFAGMNFCACNQ